MFDPKLLDNLVRTITEALPTGAREIHREMEKNVRIALTGAFKKLDLVTREELEVQSGVLARTRAKLETLEKDVAALEARLMEKGAARPGSDRPLR